MSNSKAVHPNLESEMRRTLLAELGARAIYGQLAAMTRDEELTRVLERLRAEEVDQIAELTRIFGVRFALRICCDAERTAARWYATFRTWLLEQERDDLALACDRLGLNKHRHAEILSTWIEHAPRRT